MPEYTCKKCGKTVSKGVTHCRLCNPARRSGGNRRKKQTAKQPDELLPLDMAQRNARCRICGKVFHGAHTFPVGWETRFASLIYPEHVVIDFGKECAHAKCLNP